MVRFKALRLIQENLTEIVDSLETLKSTLEPEFQRRNFRVFDVGVDVVETSVRNSIEYNVRVYDPRGKLPTHDVSDAVRKVVPNYQGSVEVISVATPYPVDSFLGLDLLKDMKQSKE